MIGSRNVDFEDEIFIFDVIMDLVEGMLLFLLVVWVLIKSWVD